MARIFQQQYTRPVPAEVKFRRRGGRSFAFIGGEWRPCNDARTRYTVTCDVWSMEFRNAAGKKQIKSTKCRDKQAAQGVLQRTLQQVEKIRGGLTTDTLAEASRHAGSGIESHIAAWLASLKANGRSAKWQESCRYSIHRLRRECTWTRLVDLSYDSFDKWLRGRDMGARTRNAYRETLVAFCSWCATTKRLAANPFTDYPVANVAADPKRPRGAFTHDELQKLLDATEARSPARAIAYRVMSLTGLRVNELRSLLVRDFDGKTLRLSAKGAKNKKAAAIPLRADLVERLEVWVANRPGAEPLIKLPAKLTRRLDGDMKAAGIEKIVDGRSRDVHSFRHTFATMLALAGVHPRTAQKLLRHSSIHLTMRFYTDATQLDDAAAVESLKPLES